MVATRELPYTTDALLYREDRETWLPVRVMSRVRAQSVPVKDTNGEGPKVTTMRLVRVLVCGEREPRFIEVSRLKEPPG